MTATAAHRMSRVDTAWLRMDNDVNLMMIVGVWLLDRPPSPSRPCASASPTSCSKYQALPASAWTAMRGLAPGRSTDFDIARHGLTAPGVRLKEREAPAGACAAALATEPLDPDRIRRGSST